MIRSLSVGVSGMVNHQQILDTVSNNLANISTTGFKSSTVSFSNSLTQTMFSGSAPSGSVGGRNPNQVGLGVQTASVNVNTRQGSFLATGRTFDLAIQGEGFFEVGKTDDTGALTEQYFTRVGNFGLDSQSNLVDLGSGLKVVGKITDSAGVAQGNLTAVDLSNNGSMDAAATQVVTFKGNLSSTAGALRGQSLTTAFPLTELSDSGQPSAATESTILSKLTTFNSSTGLSPITPPVSPDRTIYVFGTKPNGEAYASEFTINPWTDTVSTLTNKLNNALTHGSDVFATVRLSNGILTAEGVGQSTGFSMFVGERDPISGIAAFSSATSPGLAGTIDSVSTTLSPAAITALQAGALDPTFTMPAVITATAIDITVQINGADAGTVSIPAGNYTALPLSTFQLDTFPNVTTGDLVTYTYSGPNLGGGNSVSVSAATHGLDDAVGVSYSGTAITIASRTIQASEAGLLQPTFTVPAGTYGGGSGTLKISVKINGNEVGSINPDGVITAPDNVFSLENFPHVKAGDVVSYDLSGSKVITSPDVITWTTDVVSDSDTNNLTADTDDNGIPDLFEEGSSIDPSAWQYEKATNATMNWYKMRFADEFVPGSIQVYDENGGSHILETRFFRTGTNSTTSGTNITRNNGWDVLVNVSPEDGTLTDDLITGIQFDAQGRFVGTSSLGTTIKGTSLADSNLYVGTPTDNSIGVNWATTGSAQLLFDFGDTNTTNGVTGFSTNSTAAAILQDGNANGDLQTLSVEPNGNIVGLYSNGKSLPLYQLQLALFANPGGLNNKGGNLWAVSTNSGDPIIREPGTAGSGTIASGVLEGSNVDIASEFTRMITAQRGFQVNARVIQTSDSILQELTTLIR
jgi:flagellar hook protein FlgE